MESFPRDALSHQLPGQIQEAFRVLNNPTTRRVRLLPFSIKARQLTVPQAYEVHHRPLPEQTPTRAEPKPSTPSRTTTPVPTLTPTPTPTPTQAPTPPRVSKHIACITELPHSSTVVVVEHVDEAHERQMKERSEWASKSEERRLDKLKAYIVSEEIQSLGQKQAALVERMVRDLFALTPEWETRRMKARAVSVCPSCLINNHSRSLALLVV